MGGFEIRGATPADARFMGDMLVEAANWSVTRARPRVAILDDPTVSQYIAGWKRPGDFGSVAVDSHGIPIGACWARLFPPNAPGFGFVAVGVPELTLGVNPQWRAQGVGRALLKAISGQARAAGHSRLSLSVERANFAQRLYVSEGYVTIESRDLSDTMVATLR
jgi:GNAT superfamily N-acetyltransferase